MTEWKDNGRYTVLLVDDEPNILRALVRLFRGEPINVLTANSAEEALTMIREQSIQLLITDNLMPGMSGVELIKKVKEVSPDTIRMILSGHSDMEAILKAVNEGEAYRFVLKPWSDIDMKITVNIALAQYKLIQNNRELLRQLDEKNRLLDNLRANHPELFAVDYEQQVYSMDHADSLTLKESASSEAPKECD